MAQSSVSQQLHLTSSNTFSQEQLEQKGLVESINRAKRHHVIKVWATRIALVFAWLASWEFVAENWIGTFFYSKPSLVWDRLIQWFTNGTQFGTIWENLGVTVLEAVIGFIIGSITGVIFGILLGRSRYLAEVATPFIKAANAIPRIILAALFFIWFGSGLSSKVATVFVLVFFVVFFNAFSGAREVDPNVINNARILGANRRKILTSIVLPSTTSWILSSMHTAFGFALIGAIVGEYAGASRGMGLLISNAQGSFDTAGIFAAMLIVTVVALLTEWVLTVIENLLLKWKPQQSINNGKI